MQNNENGAGRIIPLGILGGGIAYSGYKAYSDYGNPLTKIADAITDDIDDNNGLPDGVNMFDPPKRPHRTSHTPDDYYDLDSMASFNPGATARSVEHPYVLADLGQRVPFGRQPFR